MAERPAFFLDRDGTLVADHGYPDDPAAMVPLPGVVEAMQLLRRAGFLLVLVSNQSAIGRGMLSVDRHLEIHAALARRLASSEVELDGAYYCPHTPWASCKCRKPSPGLLQAAVTDLGIDVKRSFMVGDRQSDIGAGLALGCKTILLGNWDEREADSGYVFSDLLQAARSILPRELGA